MLPLSTFDLTKEPLLNVLKAIEGGEIQLADFQRDWCWDDERIRSLLSSIALGFPIGSFMLLEQEKAQFRLKPRLVEGVALDHSPAPQALILDGQQRLTSLFMALFSLSPVRINRGKRYVREQRWYYFQMEEMLALPEEERFRAILGLKEDKRLRRAHVPQIDCSTPEREDQAHCFPLSQVFQFPQWRGEHNKYWQYQPEKLALIDQFEAEVIKKFEHYQLGLYILRAELPKKAVCQIFVNHNARPCELTHFDLLTSEYASEEFDLRGDWQNREQQFSRYRVLRLLKPTDFLQALSLLVRYYQRLEAKKRGVHLEKLPRISCNRQDVLDVSLSDYQTWRQNLSQGFEAGARFLHGQGIFDADDVPYPMQLVVLAPLMAILGESVKLDAVRRKLEQWLYCGAASGIYSRSRESTAAKDLIEMPGWVWEEGAIPTTIREASLQAERLQSCVNSQGATYRAISALLRRDGALDFLTGEAITEVKYFEEGIENHHIFPQKWCQQRGIARSRYNSIVNKTPLTWRTNRFLGSVAPSVYLQRLEEKGMSKERVDEILRSHLIEPELLRGDDFEGFFAERTRVLLGKLYEAMGKKP